MISVLVVDDESIMREAFSRLFDWESYGLVQAGQAKNGKEALEFIREKDVDIVITDLKMPVMDGLTLIMEAKKIKPSLKFVVMSAFDNFDLVSEAYKLGIKDYFLKVSLDPQKILELLSKLAEEIQAEKRATESRQQQQEKEARQQEKLQKIEAIMSANEQVFREQLFKKLFWSKNGYALVSAQMQDSGIEIAEESLRVMVVVLENYYEIEKSEWETERELLKFGILNLTEEISQNLGGVYGFCNLPHEYVFLYSEKNRENPRDFALTLFSHLQENMERCFGFQLSGGLSPAHDGFDNCQQLYQLAHEACACTFLRGKGILIDDHMAKANKAGRAVNFAVKAEAFKKFLPKAREPQQLLNSIPVYRLDAGSIMPEQKEAVRELFYTYYYEILAYINLYNLHERTELIHLADTFIHKLKDEGTLPELNKWLVSMLESLAKEIEQTSLASKAQHYIKQNYNRDISLGDVAAYLGISESYLSRVFKKETGDSFSGYILQVRMDAAVELMKNTNYKVYEIAEMVGYKNVEYFSRQFKKVTGKAPSAF